MHMQEEWDATPILKAAELRVTPQRVAILETMKQMGQVHPTAEEIYSHLKNHFPAISFATVYNALKSFLDADIIHELRYGDKASRYDLNTVNHHHLICDRCGMMMDVYLPEIDISAAVQEHHFDMRSYHIEVRGLCKNCRDLDVRKAD
ncbi:MAG: Fur family transcriptional regulator [Acidibacillus sp.]|uniref:Peroxide-responsive repressor PerR n=1 Tax=Sulfoacidibacillus ferrooxidans TaxID=2005001 RepID=A0A9X2AAS8_9BACL|nr:Fur family transcriptional regulator [Sulfoacidibacillus ferrooxidans]MCI0182183.1 Peroxide-responsive repressor PerR [Sulfoacidibacillus ferrooxidans]MCY0894410.1 Fur family transcriptional regulator [Acidibacillus sp.]